MEESSYVSVAERKMKRKMSSKSATRVGSAQKKKSDSLRVVVGFLRHVGDTGILLLLGKEKVGGP